MSYRTLTPVFSAKIGVSVTHYQTRGYTVEHCPIDRLALAGWHAQLLAEEASMTAVITDALDEAARVSVRRSAVAAVRQSAADLLYAVWPKWHEYEPEVTACPGTTLPLAVQHRRERERMGLDVDTAAPPSSPFDQAGNSADNDAALPGTDL